MTTTIEAIVSLVLLVCLFQLLLRPWQEVCTDIARQILFESRDKIFDLAIAKKLDFKSHQYKTIRTALEKNIRFAHQMTFMRFIMLSSTKAVQNHVKRNIFRSSDTDTSHVGKTNLRVAIDSIEDAEVRLEVDRVVKEGYSAITAMMVCRSPVLLLLGIMALLMMLTCMKLKKKVISLRSIVACENGVISQKVGERFQAEAEAA